MGRQALQGRRAKVVCTLGPGVDDDASVEQLMKHGMDAARINMSFGSIEEHVRRIRQLRQVNESLGQRPVAIIADLPGRKPRLGHLVDGSIRLETKDTVRLIPDRGQEGDARNLPVPDAFFNENLAADETVLLADGLVELHVRNVQPGQVEAEVIYGGEVTSRTGLFCQSMPVLGGPLTEADRPFLAAAVAEGVDYIALGWIQDDTDILTVREHIAELGADIPIIAKIERPEAFSRLDGILRRADAVMIRRGDLGNQIEVTRVPLVQKEILRLANRAGKPVIIATQMLGSMIDAPRPTRAEASDVSNAIADGADGVLLSAETSIGRYPVESVSMMGRIIRETEQEHFDRLHTHVEDRPAGFADTTASIAVEAAKRIQARLVVCFTESGRTAGLVAKYRPRVPIIAFCRRIETRRRLALYWGVRSDSLEAGADIDEMVEKVEERLVSRNLIQAGERLVLVFGAPAGTAGRTNTVRLHRANPKTVTVDL